MIPKMSSKDLMDLLEQSQKSIKDIRDEIGNVRDRLDQKTAVISNAQEYAMNELLNINEALKAAQSNTGDIIVFGNENMSGAYSRFGTTIHPAFTKEPHDIFNLSSVTGKIFKNNMIVKINDIAKEEYKNMLMHDSITDKGITFEEFDSSKLKLEILVNRDALMGGTEFNIIEFMPFIPGSFTIKDIMLYTMADALVESQKGPSFGFYRDIPAVGNCRFMLDQNRTLYRIVMDIELNFRNSNGKYPFGLKHLYFLKGNYNPNSNIVVKISRRDYIDWVSDEITLHDQNGISSSTLKEEGIKLYMNYTGGALSYEIEPSHGLSHNVIPRNIKDIFVSIPVKKSMISIRFKEIALRN